MSCDEVHELLSAHVDGELDPAEAARVEKHVEACPACAGKYDALDRAAGLVGTIAKAAPSVDFLRKLDERLEVEMRVDGLVRTPSKPWRSGRIEGSRGRVLHGLRRVARVAAVVLLAGLAYWVYLLKMAERPEHVTEAPPPPPAVRPDPSSVPEDGETIEEGGSPLAEVGNGNEPESARALQEIAAEVRGAPAEGDPGAVVTVEPEPPELATKPVGEPRPFVEVIDPKERDAHAKRLLQAFLNPRRPAGERAEVLYQLVKMGGPRAEDALRRILMKGEHPAYVEHAALAARTYPSREALIVLLEHATAAKGRERAPAAVRARRALAEGTTPEHVAWLATEVLPRLADGEARALVAEALAARAKDGGAGAVAALGAALEKSQRLPTRVRIVAALGQAGRVFPSAALPALRAALEDRNAAVRAAAALALGVAGPAAAGTAGEDLARLAGRLADDPEPLVRAAAARALPAFGGKAAVDALVQAIDRKGEAARVRGAALLALHRATGEGLHAAAEWRAWWAQNREVAALPAPGKGPAIVIAAPPPPESYRGIPILSDGVVFLLDASSSMAHEGRFESARRELVRALKALPAGTPFAVAVFGHATRFAHAGGLVRAAPATVAEAVAFVEARRPDGFRRDVDVGLSAALRLPGIDTVVLIPDGSPADEAVDATLETVRRLNWQGAVRIHAVGCYGGLAGNALDAGVGGGPALEFLRRLTLENGGVFVHD